MNEKLSSELEKHVKSEILTRANVVGWSKTLQPKIVDGRAVDELLALQIHVREKLPERELRKYDLVPKIVEDIKTDVLFVGEIRALGAPLGLLPLSMPKIVQKTEKHRPLVHGISIGNETITAGTNGNLVVAPDNEVYEATNAHVGSPDVTLDPADVTDLKILQPGPYDLPAGANPDDYCVGYYVWHKQLHPIGGPSECPVGKIWAGIYNYAAALARCKTRLKATVDFVNHIDLCVWKPIVDYKEGFFDSDLPADLNVGRGFAGSDVVSLVHKVQYAVAEGFKPYNKPYIAEVPEGTIFHKSGRTSCYTKAPLIVQSAAEIVNYGAVNILLDDVYVTEKMLDPGDSGDSVWVKEN